MSIYDHRIVAQIYDKIHTEKDDINLIQDLIGGHSWKILEPMCGTGRIISELARDGHEVVGIENSTEMMEEARKKLSPISRKWRLENKSVTDGGWGGDFDLVIIGRDSLLELATEGEQEQMISHAYSSLKTGGKLFIDCPVFTDKNAIPFLRLNFQGENDYGTIATCHVEKHSIDRNQKLRLIQKLTSRTIDGEERKFVHSRISHIPSAQNIRQWLVNGNFKIIHGYCDYQGRQYGWGQDRVIFWAVKEKSPAENR